MGGKLLKTNAASLQDVDVEDVAVAFDMNFDDKTEDKKEVNAKTTLLDKKDSKKKKSKGKESEGDKKTTPGGQYVTPGGPDDDDEDNPPPAPAPPKDLQNMDEYDLL